MKFTDGQWLMKEKHIGNYPAQVFDVTFDGTEMIVYAYFKPVQWRDQTIDQGIFTIHFQSDQTDTISVTTNLREGIRDRFPIYECFHNDSIKPSFRDSAMASFFQSGQLEAIVFKDPFRIEYWYQGEKLTESSHRSHAVITNQNNEVFIREQLSLGVGETVYGMGEHFTSFIKNSQTIDIWNEDGGTSSELAYKNIPFYLTNRNYGVFVRHTERVSFETASEHVEKVQFSVEGYKLSYTVIGGGSMKQVLVNYCQLTGKPALPPAWSFGLWLSTSFTTDYDETTVTDIIDTMAKRDLPLHVFHFDCFWMKPVEWCNFTWNTDIFPDPEGMLRRLKEKGLKICVWINPYIAQKSPLFAEGMKQHYLVEYANGDVWQWDRWQAGMGLVDFTNPDAVKWFLGKLKILLDMGVDCFKTDFGERIPTNVVWYDGSDPNKMHNYYTYLYNKYVFELLKQERGDGEAVLFARSAAVGGQQYPVHWGGDCWGTYESMAESLRGGLSLCMSGFGFWSHDIGGFEKTATPDLYKRWVAFGLLSTHSRLHGSTSYRVPWLFDEEAVDVLRFFTKLRCKLMPYLWSQAIYTTNTGIPMMRSMILEFSETACKYLDMQYMLGDSLLIAPVFHTTGHVEYYLPKGKWVDFFTGEIKTGGSYYENDYDYFHLPLYLRSASILAYGNQENDVIYAYGDSITFLITPLSSGEESTCFLYDVNKNKIVDITVKRTETVFSVQLSYQADMNNIHLLFYGVKDAVNIVGAEVLEDTNGMMLLVKNGIKTVEFEVLGHIV